MSAQLFDLVPGRSAGPGPVETKMNSQIRELTRLGLVTPAHSGLVELCLTVARDIDTSQGIGRPSGRAGLYKVMSDMLELLPKPEANGGDAMSRIMAFIEGSE